MFGSLYDNAGGYYVWDRFWNSCIKHTLSILESKILGAGLTNNSLSEDIRDLYDKFITSLIDYLNINNKESRAFLELCTNNIQNISENNFVCSY
jgi:hypothetical protein